MNQMWNLPLRNLVQLGYKMTFPWNMPTIKFKHFTFKLLEWYTSIDIMIILAYFLTQKNDSLFSKIAT